MDVAVPAVVSRAVVGVAAAGEAALAGQEAAVVSAVAVAVLRAVAGVASPGAAVVSVVVGAAAVAAGAGSKWLQPITVSPVLEMGVRALYHYRAPRSAERVSVSALSGATMSGRGCHGGLGLAT